MKLYQVHPMVVGKGYCKCREMRGGYSPLLLEGAIPNEMSGGKKVDMTKVRGMLSQLSPNPKKKFISI